MAALLIVGLCATPLGLMVWDLATNSRRSEDASLTTGTSRSAL
jgi:hypothetical protein